MTKFTTVLVLFIAINLVGFTAMGQDNTATNTISLGMPEVAKLSGVGSVSLTLSPQNAGQAVSQSKSDSTARVLISSVITGENYRTITAKISNGTVPTGTALKLVSLTPNANFVGTAGTPETEFTLSGTDQSVVTGIGTCYSGTSAGDGYPLKYTYQLIASVANYADIRAVTGQAVTVTLTITAAVN